MHLTFFGAAGSVTGSKHLLTTEYEKILLDCGAHQGQNAHARNHELPFDPTILDAIILSHAHLDHCGLLPLCVKQGFAKHIHSTPATRDIARSMLADAAKIEEQDTAYATRHQLATHEPYFTSEDIPPTLEKFTPTPYARHHHTWKKVTDNVSLKFYDAGHILGSAVTVLRILPPESTGRGEPLRTSTVDVSNDKRARYIAYTGDLGPPGLPLLHDPEIPQEPIDTLILESTYGSHRHEPLDTALTRLSQIVNHVCQRGGKIIMPAFSLGRTQMIVYLLHKLTDAGKIPRFPIYVDSPLATDITEVMKKDSHNYDAETWQDFSATGTPLAFSNLTYIRSIEESKALNTKPGPSLIIASSGMMTAGRVLHHLRHSVANPENAILITGYQAEGTLGRKMLEGTSEIKIHGDTFPARAEVYVFNEFSAHADKNQLQAYAEKIKGLRRVILVHGEPHQADDLKAQLQSAHPEWEVARPNEGDTIEI